MSRLLVRTSEKVNVTPFSRPRRGAQGSSSRAPTLTPTSLLVSLKSAVNRSFTSRVMKAIESDLEAVVEQLLDDIDPRQPVDIAESLTIPLPVALISHFMGIPFERKDDLRGCLIELIVENEPQVVERDAGDTKRLRERLGGLAGVEFKMRSPPR